VSPDHARKSLRALDLCLEFDAEIEWLGNIMSDSDNKTVDALEVKRQELKEERYKLQATKIEANRYDRQNSRFDLFYENIREAIERLPVPEFKSLNYFEKNENEYVCCFSDLHYGANFKAQNNEYSREICKERLNLLLEELTQFVYDNDVVRLKVVNIGDTIQGLLRIGDLQMNDIPVVDCVVEVSRLLAQFLNQLSAVCEIDFYAVGFANHSQTRNLGSKASELAYEDMERIIVSYISDLLADNRRVRVISDFEKDYLVIDLFDYKVIAVHGHQIKDVKSVIKDYSNLHRTFYTYAFLGHRHTSHEIVVGEDGNKNVSVLNCPSIIGSCPYADKLLVGSKAAAKVYTFDPMFGHIESKTIILN